MTSTCIYSMNGSESHTLISMTSYMYLLVSFPDPLLGRKTSGDVAAMMHGDRMLCASVLGPVS